ncbi:hypothetical protein C8R47DRAFT_1075578 [Mycena vitilis]|nr:hypothetical protein C8R47DRAFT_1075578 [Mycena vitilis]
MAEFLHIGHLTAGRKIGPKRSVICPTQISKTIRIRPNSVALTLDSYDANERGIGACLVLKREPWVQIHTIERFKTPNPCRVQITGSRLGARGAEASPRHSSISAEMTHGVCRAGRSPKPDLARDMWTMDDHYARAAQARSMLELVLEEYGGQCPQRKERRLIVPPATQISTNVFSLFGPNLANPSETSLHLPMPIASLTDTRLIGDTEHAQLPWTDMGWRGGDTHTREDGPWRRYFDGTARDGELRDDGAG